MGQLDHPEVQQELQREGIGRDAYTSERIGRENQDFAKAMDWKIAEGKGIQPSGAADRRRHQLVIEEWKNLQKSGWDFATVVNMLPWEVTIRPPYGIYTVPAPNKKKGEAFHMYTLKVPAMPTRDLGDAMFYPTPVLPVAIAQEFEQQNLESGGVFYFRGAEPPENFGAMIALGVEKMKAGMEKRVMDAQSNWLRTSKNPRSIDNNDKAAARWLYDQGFADQLPEWMTLTRDESVTTSCKFCGEPIRKTATVCKHCNRDVSGGASKASDSQESSVEAITKRVMDEIQKNFNLIPKDAVEAEVSEESAVQEEEPPHNRGRKSKS